MCIRDRNRPLSRAGGQYGGTIPKHKPNGVNRSGGEVVIDTLDIQGVRHIFGIPGAKVDGVFDVLVDRGPQLVVCRHEQNAAFMAAAVGRLTGRPGVCLVTSGPGASNLVTGLLTATTEGDPVVALVGAVTRSHTLKLSAPK